MTLADLIHKAREVGAFGALFNSWYIPLMKDGLNVDFDLEVQGSNDEGWYIEITNYREGKNENTNSQKGIEGILHQRKEHSACKQSYIEALG